MRSCRALRPNRTLRTLCAGRALNPLGTLHALRAANVTRRSPGEGRRQRGDPDNRADRLGCLIGELHCRSAGIQQVVADRSIGRRCRLGRRYRIPLAALQTLRSNRALDPLAALAALRTRRSLRSSRTLYPG